MVGGCWGARPAVAYALGSQDELAGLALVCPALKAQVDLSPKDKLQVGLGRVFDEHRKIPVPLTPELFTRNPQYLEFIRNDPLSLHEVTARFFFETAIWDRYLLRQTRLKLPLLLLQAGDDRIIDRGTVREWFGRQARPTRSTSSTRSSGTSSTSKTSARDTGTTSPTGSTGAAEASQT